MDPRLLSPRERALTPSEACYTAQDSWPRKQWHMTSSCCRLCLLGLRTACRAWGTDTRIHTHTRVCTRMHAHAHTCSAHVHAHRCTRSHTCTHVRACTHIMRTQMHMHTHKHMHTHMCAHMHACTYTSLVCPPHAQQSAWHTRAPSTPVLREGVPGRGEEQRWWAWGVPGFMSGPSPARGLWHRRLPDPPGAHCRVLAASGSSRGPAGGCAALWTRHGAEP